MAITVKGGGGVVIPQDAQGKLYLKDEKPIVVNEYQPGLGEKTNLKLIYEANENDRYLGQDNSNDELFYYNSVDKILFFINNKGEKTYEYSIENSENDYYGRAFINNYKVYFMKNFYDTTENKSYVQVYKYDLKNKNEIKLFEKIENSVIGYYIPLAVDQEENCYYLYWHYTNSYQTAQRVAVIKFNSITNYSSTNSLTLNIGASEKNYSGGIKKRKLKNNILMFQAERGGWIDTKFVAALDLQNFSILFTEATNTNWVGSMASIYSDCIVNTNGFQCDILKVGGNASNLTYVPGMSRLKYTLDEGMTTLFISPSFDMDELQLETLLYKGILSLPNNKKIIGATIHRTTDYIFNTDLTTESKFVLVDDNNKTSLMFDCELEIENLISFGADNNIYGVLSNNFYQLQFSSIIYLK